MKGAELRVMALRDTAEDVSRCSTVLRRRCRIKSGQGRGFRRFGAAEAQPCSLGT